MDLVEIIVGLEAKKLVLIVFPVVVNQDHAAVFVEQESVVNKINFLLMIVEQIREVLLVISVFVEIKFQQA